jgi:hypothetical protein
VSIYSEVDKFHHNPVVFCLIVSWLSFCVYHRQYPCVQKILTSESIQLTTFSFRRWRFIIVRCHHNLTSNIWWRDLDPRKKANIWDHYMKLNQSLRFIFIVDLRCKCTENTRTTMTKFVNKFDDTQNNMKFIFFGIWFDF